MARMTMAQKREQEQQQIAEKWEQFRASYNGRLVKVLLFFASTPGFVVRKLDFDTYEFSWEDRNRNEQFNVNFPESTDWRFELAFTSTEDMMCDYADWVAEQERLRVLKQNALAKLSLEEKKALNLM